MCHCASIVNLVNECSSEKYQLKHIQDLGIYSPPVCGQRCGKELLSLAYDMTQEFYQTGFDFIRL